MKNNLVEVALCCGDFFFYQQELKNWTGVRDMYNL